VRDQVRVEADVTDRHVTIVECRPPWRADLGPEWTRFPIARLRYTKASKRWSLYWRDRNLRFHEYDRVSPTDNVEELWRRWTATRRRSSGAEWFRLPPAGVVRVRAQGGREVRHRSRPLVQPGGDVVGQHRPRPPIGGGPAGVELPLSGVVELVQQHRDVTPRQLCNSLLHNLPALEAAANARM